MVDNDDPIMVRQIINAAGYDTETGIYGVGCSYDNGKTFKVYWTIFGRKYYQEDADRLWPFLKDKIGEIKGGSLSVSWSEILNKPDVATQEDLKKIELKPGPQGPQGLPGKDGKDAIDTVKTITSGTLSSLSTGKYEIECLPSDAPIQERGLCDVVVGQHYAKQVFTVTGATGDDQGNVYVRVRDYSGQWHEWRELTAWN